MKATLAVKLAFLPAVIFAVLMAVSTPGLALDIAAAAAMVAVGLNIRAGRRRPLETALLLTLAGPAVLTHAGYDLTAQAVTLQLLGQGLAGLWCAARGEAWTAPYAAGAHPEVAHTETFRRVNAVISHSWTLLFLLLAGLSAVEAPGWISGGLVAAGLIASSIGPQWLARRLMPAEALARTGKTAGGAAEDQPR